MDEHNINGQLVLMVLSDAREAIPLKEIISRVSDATGLQQEEVKDSIIETLNGGVRYGFIQRKNRKFFTSHVKLEEIPDEPGNTDDESSDDEEHASDRTLRGRKRTQTQTNIGGGRGKGRNPSRNASRMSASASTRSVSRVRKTQARR